MTYIYQLRGMICASCETKVKNTLLKLPEITTVEVSKEAESDYHDGQARSDRNHAGHTFSGGAAHKKH